MNDSRLVSLAASHPARVPATGVHNWGLGDEQIRTVLELAAQKLPRH